MKTAFELKSKIKRNSLVFFSYMRVTDSLYRSNYIDYLLRKQKKPRALIKNELNLIRDYWKCDPMTYYRYRLFEKNLTKEELLDYVPPYYFYNYYIPSIYNESKIKLAASKIQMSEYFKSKHIPIPETVSVAINGIIYANGERIDYDGFIDRLKHSEARKFFMKPENGQGGKGILRIEKNNGEIFINNKVVSRKSFDDIIKRHDYLIQEGLIQRSDIMEIYPDSVNTLRVVTQNFDGKPQISAVYLKMGRNGTYVDNSSSGGLSTYIDMESGRSADFAINHNMNKKLDRHPDTGFVFDGFIIRDWQKIKEAILDIAGKAVDFPDIGWDIAIVEGGIAVIELNLNWGIDLQGIVGGMRKMLNIEPFIAPVKVTFR